jgi:hypothetical protein
VEVNPTTHPVSFSKWVRCVCVLRAVRSSCRSVFCFVSVLFGLGSSSLAKALPCCMLQWAAALVPRGASLRKQWFVYACVSFWLCRLNFLFLCVLWGVEAFHHFSFVFFFLCVSLFFSCPTFSIFFVRRECAVKSWSSSWLSYICCFLCLFCKEFRLLIMSSSEDLFRLLRSSHNNNFSQTYAYSFQNGPFLLHCTSIMCLLPFIMS